MTEDKKYEIKQQEPEKFAKPEKYDIGFWISLYYWFTVILCIGAGIYFIITEYIL